MKNNNTKPRFGKKTLLRLSAPVKNRGLSGLLKILFI